MKTGRKVTLGLIGLMAMSFTGLIAATAGSLAWYAFSRSTGASFIGTSVAKTLLLNIGIVDEYNYISQATIDAHELRKETVDGRPVVFAKSTNGLDYRVIKEYLTNSGHASDMLFPLTTRKRTLNTTDDLALYKAPNLGETTFDEPATIEDYVEIPFAFRVDTRGTGGAVAADIWLVESSIKASGQNIDQAVRIFIKNSQRSFLFKPADKTTVNKGTKVGGLLDLDGNGTYDFDGLTGEEYYYGTYDHDTSPVPAWDSLPYGIDYDHADFVNVNHVENPSGKSTFYAKHHEDALIINNAANIIPEEAKYFTFGNVKPSVKPNGDYYEGDTGFKICTTDSADGVGYATFTVFIEGWDHSVIDLSAGHNFNLGLRFEMNRF